MTDLTLVIGNKNYSSWSLRAWLVLKATGEPFREELIALDRPDTQDRIGAHGAGRTVPILHHGGRVVWESLAIAEYLAEFVPGARLWPADTAARAAARAVSAEMHAGFQSLCAHMPMNVRKRLPGKGRAPGVDEDIRRIVAIWEDSRRRYGAPGPFLFGEFGVADAMYAPVVSRFRTYEVELPETARAYADAVWSLPALAEWSAAARSEPYTIAHKEF